MISNGITVHRIRRGLDIPISGAPEQRVEDGPAVRRVAVVADDYVGLRPRMLVTAGDAVLRGTPLFEDRGNPGVRCTSPGTGRVVAVNRGERRALQTVVIELDDTDAGPGAEAPEVEYAAFTGAAPAGLDPASVRALLLEAGLWPALRRRPFDRVPSPAETPRSIFVTATDTEPLTADPVVALAGREGDFEAGLAALVRLADGRPVHLCRGPGAAIPGAGVPGVRVHEFLGPHPAGNAGVHIHHVDPADRDRPVWHAGYQDVAAMGGLFLRGRVPLERVIALGGPAALRPRLLRTRFGASLDELTAGELAPGEARVISGSVLSGRSAMGPIHGFLGRRHHQVSVLPEAGERRFLGWMAPGWDRFSAWRLFLSTLRRGRRFDFDTDTNGGERAVLPSFAFDAVLPFDTLPVFLFKALLAGDVERAEALGCLELAEEDVALCSFVCPSKIDYGAALRGMLARIEKEG
jgi:Na+-transporting NADH:ubiquinone oxidoreductase subunit A